MSRAIVFFHVQRLENLLFGLVAGSFALYDALGWLLPHFGLLSVPTTLSLCLSGGLFLGLQLTSE